MITPRRTRLIRVPDLRALHAAIAALACQGDMRRVRASAVVVPSRAAARTLRHTLEHRLLTSDGAAAVWPDFVNRADLYALLHARLPDPPPLLTPMDRQVLMSAACRDAASRGLEPPFKPRPGLVGAMLDLYDELRRQPQTLERFEDLLVSELESTVDIDRGAERLLTQTRFLVAAFRAYEGRMRESGAVDEHALRALLMATPSRDPLRHVVMTVGDRVSGADGFWPADFDLLTRIPALDALDVVATARELGAGFFERVHDLLPGIEDVQWAESGAESPGDALVLLAPPDSEDSARVFTARDREEELAGIARRLRSARRQETADVPAVALDRTAVVFSRPLPYLYLARDVFASAGIPYQAADTLPLAAEPFAAALDLVLTLVSSAFSRNALVGVLGSPQLSFEIEGGCIESADASALEETLTERGFLGGIDAFDRVVTNLSEEASRQGKDSPLDRTAMVARAAREAAGELAELTSPARASAHLTVLLGFLHRHERALAIDDPLRERHLRARSAIVSGLEVMLRAHERFDDPMSDVDDIAATLRRWIEAQTFSPRTGSGGLHLLDARAARYGDLDAVHLVGLIDGEWPEPSSSNVFYSAGLLKKLGWPGDRDRLAAARAAFDDLLRLSRRVLSVSTFSLEHDSIVEPSSLLEGVAALQASVVRMADSRARIFRHEALGESPANLSMLGSEAAAWALLRASRTDAGDPRYRGFTGPLAPRPYSVGGLERHLDCPFKYFAERVLHLEAEEDDDAIMTPRERGAFIHEVFGAFFEAWQKQGGGTITLDRIDAALGLFAGVIEPHLARLPRSEALVERTRLSGSPVAPGMAEMVFRIEAERATRVVERLLEFKLEGEFEFPTASGTTRITLRGVADRIDLLEDGTLRLIDYKSGLPPRPNRALQLPVYSICAEQVLEGRSNRSWAIGEALYIAFKGRPVVPLFSRGADRDKVLTAAKERLVEVVGAIERGEFPVQPEQPFLCTYCAFSTVCRKDYVDL